ncbi:MAG: hybrid sensor histidine kinase/response regulator [Bdellovibrionales bacterium]|nr:hybrid sensor histidine kinase/response regulator [Bdellovibrionales bacterium]
MPEPTTRAAKAKFSPELVGDREFLSVLIHKIGHEIGNPLTSIISLATIIDRFSAPDAGGLDSEKAAAYARSIIKESWRVSALTEKLVLLLSNRRGAPTPCDVVGILPRALKKLRSRRGFDSDWVRIVSRSEIPLFAFCDSDQFLVAITELLENAFVAVGAKDFADDGEPPDTPPIEVVLSGDRHRCIIEVCVPQPTASERPLDELFQPFVTAHADEKHLGLGLTVVAAIADRVGAELELEEQRLDDGYRFITRLQFPAHEGVAAAKLAPASALPSRLTILVVEDDESVASAVQKILTLELGRETKLSVICRNGEGALEYIANGEPLDVILCDLNLDGMSGRHILDTLYNDRPEAVERFVFLTGDSMRPETESYLQSCQRPFLHKPFEVDQLIETVRRLFVATAT